MNIAPQFLQSFRGPQHQTTPVRSPWVGNQFHYSSFHQFSMELAKFMKFLSQLSQAWGGFMGGTPQAQAARPEVQLPAPSFQAFRTPQVPSRPTQANPGLTKVSAERSNAGNAGNAGSASFPGIALRKSSDVASVIRGVDAARPEGVPSLEERIVKRFSTSDSAETARLTGGTNDDIIHIKANGGDDIVNLAGGGGNDTLTVEGGEGHDFLTVVGSNNKESVAIRGEQGNDSITYFNSQGDDTVFLDGGEGIDGLTIRGDQNFTVKSGDKVLFSSGDGSQVIKAHNFESLSVVDANGSTRNIRLNA